MSGYTMSMKYWFEPGGQKLISTYEAEGESVTTPVTTGFGASYEREINFRLLKDYEEIPLNAVSAGRPLKNPVVYPPIPEGRAYRLDFDINIDRRYGSGDYVLISLEGCDYASPTEMSLKRSMHMFTTRARIIFNGAPSPAPASERFKRLEPVAAGEDGFENIGKRNFLLGKKYLQNVNTSLEEATFSGLGLPVCVDLSVWLTDVGMDPVEIAEIGDHVPAVVLGYYNNEPLSEKYYAEIPADEPVFLWPGWTLPVGYGVNNLKVFMFCYPGANMEELPDAGKMLYGYSANASVYITRP